MNFPPDLPALLAVFGTLVVTGQPVTAADAEFFEIRIRPVLHDHCAECHGAKKQKGGLRLDSREGMMKGGESGAAVVPGKPEDSLLLKVVRHVDKDFKMPPPKSGPKLAEAERRSVCHLFHMGLLREKDQRDDQRRLRAKRIIPDPSINIMHEGSGTLATRKPRMLIGSFESVGSESRRSEERSSLSGSNQPPPRIARFSDEESFSPS